MSQIVPLEKDVTLALALACGASITDAAQQTGQCPKTVHRRLSEPEFRRLVAELRGQLIARAVGRMAKTMTRAADVLAKHLESDEPRLSLRAARAVLSLGLRLRDSVDLNERVAELEAELVRREGAGP